MGGGAIARLFGLTLFAGAGWLAIAIALAPIGGDIGLLPGPDLLFCLVAVVSARRPSLASTPLVFALGLARDLLGGGAVGAGALALTVASIALRAQPPTLWRRGFLVEWCVVALWAAAALMSPWLLLTVTLAQTPQLASLGGGLVATALAYPLFASVLRRSAHGASATSPMTARQA